MALLQRNIRARSDAYRFFVTDQTVAITVGSTEDSAGVTIRYQQGNLLRRMALRYGNGLKIAAAKIQVSSYDGFMSVSEIALEHMPRRNWIKSAVSAAAAGFLTLAACLEPARDAPSALVMAWILRQFLCDLPETSEKDFSHGMGVRAAGTRKG